MGPCSRAPAVPAALTGSEKEPSACSTKAHPRRIQARQPLPRTPASVRASCAASRWNAWSRRGARGR
ncbi:hypothetical protein C1J00_23910, partial [Streptomyces cahuitamycinicus]